MESQPRGARSRCFRPRITSYNVCYTKLLRCPLCRAHLFIHKDFFSSLGESRKDLLEAAVERYMRVISRERNINAYYFLSIAHLNLEHWEEALNLFHKTVKLAPNKEIFTELV